MRRVLFDEVLNASPLYALRTVTGRSKSVLETIELGVIFPLDDVVLVFGCGSAAKVERIVYRREFSLQRYVEWY